MSSDFENRLEKMQGKVAQIKGCLRAEETTKTVCSDAVFLRRYCRIDRSNMFRILRFLLTIMGKNHVLILYFIRE